MNLSASLPERDIELERLSKEATDARRAKDWPRALVAVKAANACMSRNSQVSYGVEPWLRLPLFLAEAGRWDEAKAEFSRLLNNKRVLGPWASPQWSQRGTIFDKMRLSLQRAGRPRTAIVACGLFTVCIRRARFLGAIDDPSEAEQVSCIDWSAWISEHLTKAAAKAKVQTAVPSLLDLVVTEGGRVDPNLPLLSYRLSAIVAAEESLL